MGIINLLKYFNGFDLQSHFLSILRKQWHQWVSMLLTERLTEFFNCEVVSSRSLQYRSFLAHASNVNDLLEGLDGVLKDWLDRLHDTESSLHIVDLWLHALGGFHLSGNFNKGLSVIESLEDSSGKCFLDVLDGSGLGNGGIGITSGLG